MYFIYFLVKEYYVLFFNAVLEYDLNRVILQSFTFGTIEIMGGRTLYKQDCCNIFLDFRAVSIINSIFTHYIYFLNIYNTMKKIPFIF